MTGRNCRSIPLFKNTLLALSISTVSSFAAAQEFTLQDNQLSISGGSGTTFSNQTPSISSLGVVQTVIDVPSTNGVGIPNFGFTIANNGVAVGSYDFIVGVTIDDDNSSRRIEAEIGTLTLEVKAGGVIEGTIPAQTMRVLGRTGDGSIEVQVNLNNGADNGAVTISGGTVSLNASNLITKIRNKSTVFDTAILSEFDKAASYTYRIAVQQTSGATIKFGTNDGSFTAFPQVKDAPCGANCVDDTTAFVLNSNELAADYDSASTVTGQFNVVFVATSSGGSGGGGGSTTTETADSVGGAADAIEVPTSGPVSDAVVNQVNDAVNSSNTLLTSTLSNIENGGSADDALTAITSVNKALTKAGDAKKLEGGDSVSTSSSTTAITKIADVLDALSKSDTELDANQKTLVSNLAVDTVTNAAKLLTADTPRSEILALVDATSKLLGATTDASGEITEALTTQLKALAGQASTNIIATLPESIKGSVDLNSVDSIRALLAAKPTAVDSAVSVAPVRYVTRPLTFTRTTVLSPADINSLIDSMKTVITTPSVFTVRKQTLTSIALAPTYGENGQVLAATADAPVLVENPNSAYVIEFSGNNYSATVENFRYVSDMFADGLYNLSNGRLLYVQSGEALELSATPINQTAFINAVSNAGFNRIGGALGLASIDLGNDERFSGAFSYDNLADAATECSSVSFNAPTGSPLSTDYVFEMVCSDGAVQKITPYPESEAFFTTVTNAGFDLRTDRNTGVISIEGIGDLRASFFVTPPTLADTAYLDANKTAEGIAVRAADANGDGKTDYEIISSDGVQVLYGL